MEIMPKVYCLPAAHDRLVGDGLPARLEAICSLPGVQNVEVFPDVTAKEWGYPSGLVITSRDYLYPLAVPDPGSGYHVSTLPMNRNELALSDVEEIFQSIVGTVNHRQRCHEYPMIDIDRVVDEGLAYAAELQPALGGPAAVSDQPRRSAEDGAQYSTLLDEDVRKDLRESLGGADGHYVAIQWVEEILDPSVAERQGLRPGQLVLVIHIGARPLRGYVYEHYGVPAAEQSLKDGSATPEDVAAGLFAVRADSPAGRGALGCAAASANYGYFNRHLVRVNILNALRDRLGIADIAERTKVLQHRSHAEINPHERPGQLVSYRGVQRLTGPGGEPLDDPHMPLSYVAGGEFGSSLLVTIGTDSDRFGYRCGHGIPEWEPTGDASDRIAHCLPHSRAARANAPFDLISFRRDTANLEETIAHIEKEGMARPVARLYPLINFRSPI